MSKTVTMTDYLASAFQDDPTFMIESAKRKLADLDFDTMVGVGLSGALVVPMLARALGKHFAIVRKDVSSHSPHIVEGTLGERWIFVDDIVATGETRSRARDKVAESARKWRHRIEYVGTYEYAVGDYHEGSDGYYRSRGTFSPGR